MNDFRWFTEPNVELVKTNATDEDVARAAWVSTVGEESRFKDPGRMNGLINYLMRDRHGSPFEHGSFTFFIKTPLFVRSEFHRHRVGWSYNEESGRYSEMKPHFYIPNHERNLVQTGKPGSYIFLDGSKSQHETVDIEIATATQTCWKSYQKMLEDGVAKEVARMILPLNTMTSFYATCNPRSLMHFLGLRTISDKSAYPSHPQFEINQVASKMEESFKEAMPITWNSWNENGRVTP